jgi:hypothetical protein
MGLVPGTVAMTTVWTTDNAVLGSHNMVHYFTSWRCPLRRDGGACRERLTGVDLTFSGAGRADSLRFTRRGQLPLDRLSLP